MSKYVPFLHFIKAEDICSSIVNSFLIYTNLIK